MAKYQRNLALSLVRSRQPSPLGPINGITTAPSADNSTPTDTHAPPPPLPLTRDEIDSLRGGTTREGRRLEDWHPENLVAMWCTSLLAQDRDTGTAKAPRGGAAWTRGRERTLSVLRWVSAEATAEAAGGVTAGTVVPVLAHGPGGAVPFAGEMDSGHGCLRALSASLAAYAGRDQEAAEDEARESSSRRSGSTALHIDADAATAGGVAAAPGASGLPRRLLSLSGVELAALAALLDEALGLTGASGLQNAAQKQSSSAGAADMAAALFARPSAQAKPPPPPPPPTVVDSLGGVGTVTSMGDDCANVFLLARGLRARLIGGAVGSESDSTRGSGNVSSRRQPADSTRVASSVVLGMLLASSTTQTDVLEKLCPKDSGGGLGGAVAGAGGAAQGLTWGEARDLMIPLWVRDVKELQRVTTALAANTYRQDRDLMAVGDYQRGDILFVLYVEVAGLALYGECVVYVSSFLVFFLSIGRIAPCTSNGWINEAWTCQG